MSIFSHTFNIECVIPVLYIIFRCLCENDKFYVKFEENYHFFNQKRFIRCSIFFFIPSYFIYNRKRQRLSSIKMDDRRLTYWIVNKWITNADVERLTKIYREAFQVNKFKKDILHIFLTFFRLESYQKLNFFWTFEVLTENEIRTSRFLMLFF